MTYTEMDAAWWKFWTTLMQDVGLRFYVILPNGNRFGMYPEDMECLKLEQGQVIDQETLETIKSIIDTRGKILRAKKGWPF